MASTAPEALACCVRGEQVPDALLDRLAAEAATESGTRALFTDLIEPLSDSFEPRLAAAYVDTFARLIARVDPAYDAPALIARHAALAGPDPGFRPRRVVVLSRVTLGADIAVASPFLASAIEHFPEAEILFAGNAKNFELFAAHPRLGLLETRYGRTALLADRLAVGRDLAGRLDDGETLVIDPDSRLSQLGLLPFGPPERYLFFPSRSYGAATAEPLSRLASAFLADRLGGAARPFLAPRVAEPLVRPDVAVSLGVGENPAKRLDDGFEQGLIAGLLDQGHRVLLDSGAGGEETARVERIAARCAGRALTIWQGAFAPFAEAIKGAGLYIGYDSAGQHVAAAAGTPLITVFAGAPNERFLARWRPAGAGPARLLTPGPETLGEVLALSSPASTWRGHRG